MLSRTETFRVHGWLKDRPNYELGESTGHVSEHAGPYSRLCESRRREPPADVSAGFGQQTVTLCDVPALTFARWPIRLHDLISLAPGDSPA